MPRIINGEIEEILPEYRTILYIELGILCIFALFYGKNHWDRLRY